MKIEIISGSPRINSLTRRVALHLKNLIKEITEHEVDIIDMKDWTVPPVQSVWVSIDKTPEEFKSLAERIFTADAYIVVTPEYNGSYSPALKNLLDHFPKRRHKPVASPYLLITPAVDKKFNEEGELIDEKFQNAVHNFIAEFFWLAEKLVEEKVSV